MRGVRCCTKGQEAHAYLVPRAAAAAIEGDVLRGLAGVGSV